MATFLAKVEELREMLCYIDYQAREAECGADALRQIELASEEALVNIIRHAYADRTDGVIEILCTSPAKGALEIVLRDQGLAFNPLEQEHEIDLNAPLEQRPIGGLGLFLIRRLMDSVDYTHTAGMNTLTMRKSNDARKEAGQRIGD